MPKNHVAFAEIATRSENFTLAIGRAVGGKARIDVLLEHVPHP